MIEVALSWPQWVNAAHIAIRQYAAMKQLGYANLFDRPDGDERGNRIDGAIGELAVSTALGLKWNHDDPFGVDVGQNIQVKAIRAPYGGLTIQRGSSIAAHRKNHECFFVLALIMPSDKSGVRVKLVGWIKGSLAMRQKYEVDSSRGYCWQVPQTHLETEFRSLPKFPNTGG